jgi:pilus assembly protein CpaE
MDQQTARSALFSVDPDFRDTVREGLFRLGTVVSLDLEISEPLSSVSPTQIEALRDLRPEIVFLDIEQDPELGVRFAHFLTDTDPSRRVIAAGPMLPPDKLVDAMRAGLTDYLVKPVAREALEASVIRAERRRGWSIAGGSRSKGRVIAVFSPTGGSGATTLATNTAVQLHRLTGRPTLLVDLDLELGEIGLFLGAQPRFNFIDLLRNFHRMDSELLASFIDHHSSGVHLLSAPYQPERTEEISAEQIKRVLLFLRENYDYVVVDTSKSFSHSTLGVLEQADVVLLLGNATLPSLRNLKRCLPLLTQTVKDDSSRIKLVLNRHDPKDAITTTDVEKTLGVAPSFLLRNDYAAVSQSITTGEPVVLKRDIGYAADVTALASAIAGIKLESNGKKPHGRKLFGFTFKNGATPADRS